MQHSPKYEAIKTRYSKNYITDAQLLRYKQLGVITEEEYEEIYKINHPDPVEE